MEYIVKILRTLFFYIDKVVYEGVGIVYDLLLDVSRTTVLSQETIGDFSSKIYVFIGIFMLFKISVSLITYVINPDEFSDKEKGFASIVKRVIISLIMLALVPYVFREAISLQGILLEDNTLASIIFSTDASMDATYTLDTAGDKIRFILMYTFFQPNYRDLMEEDSTSNLSSCAITYSYSDTGAIQRDSNGAFILNPDCYGTPSGTPAEYPLDGGDKKLYGYYWGEENKDLYQTYVQGIARQNFYLMFRHDFVQQTYGDEKTYVVNYQFLLSTAVGVAVLWVLLMFCIDVAVRSVKLGFFQLIAPIPILSYIDPKGKDGMFQKWLSQCGTTYLSLFMRLLALYLAIYIIKNVSETGIQDVVTGERVTSLPVQILIIIGVLIFAKQLPKLLEDVMGIKGTGDFTLNPLKKLDQIPGGKLAKRVAGTTAAVGLAGLAAGGSNLITGGSNAVKNLRQVAQRGGARAVAREFIPTVFGVAGSTIAGTASAGGRAFLGGVRGEKFGKNWESSYGAAMQAKQTRSDRHSAGVKWGEMTAAKIQGNMGLHTAGEADKSRMDDLKKVQDLQEQAKSLADRDDAVKERLRTLETIKNTQIRREDYMTTRNVVDSHGNPILDEQGQVKQERVFDDESQRRYREAVAQQGRDIQQAEAAVDVARNQYYQQQTSATGDNAIKGILSQMQSLMTKNGMAPEIERVKRDAEGRYLDAHDNVVADKSQAEITRVRFDATQGQDLKAIAGEAIKEYQRMQGSVQVVHHQTVDQFAKTGKKSS